MHQRSLPLVALLFLSMCSADALAGTATGTLTITIQSPLAVVFTPPTPTVPCSAPAGTVVTSVSVTGGDGQSTAFTATAGDTTDFTVNGSNVVVGPNGIAAASCGQPMSLTVTVNQP